MKLLKNRILYLEDHVDTREFVSLVLGGLNYHVTTSSTIAEALELARGSSFDLYMLDLRLPDGSGIDLCKRLREFDQSTPIMFFSAAAYEVDKQTAIKNGAQSYLVKPADIDALCRAVGDLMDTRGEKEKRSHRLACI